MLTDKGNIEESCIWKSYWNIFPWRPPGNRMLLNGGVFGDEKETTEFFSEAKAKYVPTTATDILETGDESTVLDAKEVEDDSDEIEKRADATRKRVARAETKFTKNQKNDGNESDNSVKGSIAVSGGKVKPALSIDSDSDSSSEKEI